MKRIKIAGLFLAGLLLIFASGKFIFSGKQAQATIKNFISLSQKHDTHAAQLLAADNRNISFPDIIDITEDEDDASFYSAYAPLMLAVFLCGASSLSLRHKKICLPGNDNLLYPVKKFLLIRSLRI